MVAYDKNQTRDVAELKKAWEDLRSTHAGLRIRDAAAMLCVSEARLLSTKLGAGVTRLIIEPSTFLPQLAQLGELMALSRNEAAVHERHGVYLNPKVHGNIGLLNNADIDLRLDFSHWHEGFAESVTKEHRELHSFQFFDKTGTAVHKIYLNPASDVEAYLQIVKDFTHEDQRNSFEDHVPAEGTAPDTSRPRVTHDATKQAELLAAWVGLKDTHRFNAMIKKAGVSRLEALDLVKGTYAWPVQNKALLGILTQASDKQQAIMVFVSNPGCIQIHTGPVKNIQVMDTWFNVLDPDFNLHVKSDLLAECWIVCKITEDGPVHSLECYNAAGELVLQLFGARKPGLSEAEGWQAIVTHVRNTHA